MFTFFSCLIITFLISAIQIHINSFFSLNMQNFYFFWVLDVFRGSHFMRPKCGQLEFSGIGANFSAHSYTYEDFFNMLTNFSNPIGYKFTMQSIDA